MPRRKHIPVNMETISLAESFVPKGLREILQREADRRGMNFKLFIGACFEYALENPALFQEPLKKVGEPGGEYIGGLVSVGLKDKLDKWAARRLGTRCTLLAYLLQKVVEQELYDKILIFKQNQDLLPMIELS